MIVDAHTHIWSPNPRAYPWAPHDQVPVSTERAGVEDLLNAFDRAGVAGGLCLQPRVYGYDHAYLTSALQAYPDRLAGVCTINPVRPSGPAELRCLVKEHRYRGLRLNPMADADPAWLDGPEGEPLWREAAELALVVSVLINPGQLPRLLAVARRFRELPIVVDHLGRCTPQTPSDQVKDLVQMAQLPNVSIKISALSTLSNEPYPYQDLHPLIEACYQSFGPERLLWGTDFPHILAAGPYHLTLDAVQIGMPFIASDDLPAILGENTTRLYQLNLRADLEQTGSSSMEKSQ